MKLCDTHPVALREQVSAASLTLSLMHRARGGAIADRQPEGWDEFEAEANRIIFDETYTEPGSDSYTATLDDMWKSIVDLEYSND